jgi:hypothetical protein
MGYKTMLKLKKPRSKQNAGIKQEVHLVSLKNAKLAVKVTRTEYLPEA